MIRYLTISIKRRRGNILVMAIFIAIFLYFLSVALVSQNRQNILLVLSEDHRQRALNSANSALDLAIHVMRHNPNWESLLPGHSGELPSGGKWTIESIKRRNDLPNLLTIKAKGKLDLFSATRTRTVEEVKFSNVNATSNSNPKNSPSHLFVYAKLGDTPILATLTSDMNWHFLGPVPNPTLPCLIAQDGPLFTQALPIELEFILEDVSNDGVMQERSIKTPCVPVLTLKDNGDGFAWSNSKMPCSAFRFSSDKSETSQAQSSDSGSGIDKLTKYKDATVRNLQYKGPTLEWYTSNGSILAANGSTVYSHGMHYYYSGTIAKINSKGYTIEKKAQKYQAPALLSYDIASDTWKVVMDMMKVNDRDEEPTIVEQESITTPHSKSLVFHKGELYSLSSSDTSLVLKATANKWTTSSSTSGESLGLFSYKNSLLSHKSTSISGISGLMGYSDADIVKELYLERPASELIVDGSTTVQTSLGMNLYPSLILGSSISTSSEGSGNNSTAIFGDNIYTFALLRAIVSPPEPSLKALYSDLYKSLNQAYLRDNESTVISLAHYDGQCWQIWPNGIFDLVQNWPNEQLSENLNTLYDNTSDTKAKLLLGHIAIAQYQTSLSSEAINRYTVILDEDI